MLVETRGLATGLDPLRQRPAAHMPLEDWYRLSGTGAALIEPGSPWQNRYVESLNGRLRDELLNQELFFTLSQAQMLAEDWRTDHNKKTTLIRRLAC